MKYSTRDNKLSQVLSEEDQMIVMDRYAERVKNLSKGMKDRKSYKYLTTWIYKLCNVTFIGDWKQAELVRWLQDTHCNRPAMMEEITGSSSLFEDGCISRKLD